MSRDIQFVSMVDNLQVTGVEEIEGAIPRTLRVTGTRGFNSAQRVIINDYGLDTFTLVSDSTLLVAPGPVFDQVPVGQMDVVVVSGSLTSTNRVRLLFGPTKKTRSVSGGQKLVQQIIKSLLTNTRSNRFNTSEGGNLLKGLGDSLSLESSSKIAAVLSDAVSTTERQFFGAQANARNLPTSERLLSLTLGDVVFDSGRLEVTASIRLVTFSGRAISFPLTL